MDLGNGFHRWKTIPTLWRRATTSMPFSKMLRLSRHISPSCRIPGIKSLRRLIDRRNVDFPHPEGPINAVTARGGTAMLMFLSAFFFPYQNEKLRAAIVPTCREMSEADAGARADVIRTDP